MEYTPLNAADEEIRVVKIVSVESRPDQPDEIHCEIKNVSLLSFSPIYAKYREMMSELFDTQDLLATSGMDLQETLKVVWKSQIERARGEFETYSDIQHRLGRFLWGDYTTLSYTWGSALLEHEIYVGDVKVAISENLYEALITLWKTIPDFAKGMHIWIDALCIDQTNVEEVNTQVPRMGDIYQSSSYTYSFLAGIRDETATSLEPFLVDLATTAPHDVKGTFEFLSSVNPEKNTDTARIWIALSDFVFHPYWSRLWIVQEIILSKPTVQILFGNRQVSLSVFENVLNTLGRCPFLVKDYVDRAHQLLNLNAPLISFETPQLRHKMFQVVTERRNARKANQITEYLSTVLSLSQTSSQGQIKDKVYGIMGLLPQDISKRITPDYKYTMEEILTQFTKATVESTMSLDLLRIAFTNMEPNRPTEPVKSLPSWVLNFTNSSETMPPLLARHADLQMASVSKKIIQFSPESTKLSCSALIFDAVDGLSCSVVQKEVGSRIVAKFDSDFAQSKNQTSIYGSIEETFEAFWRTILGGQKASGAPLPSSGHFILGLLARRHDFRERLQPLEMHNQTWNYLIDFRHDNRYLQVFGHDLTSWMMRWISGLNSTTATMTDEEIEDVPEILECFLFAMMNQRLMTTEMGRIGLSCMKAKQGDRIAILHGSGSPMLLRPQSEGFSVVGECYIHGAMDGEVVSLVAEKRAEVQVITLV